MAVYDNAILTQSGERLLNEVMAGNGCLEFLFLQTGSGIYSEDEKKNIKKAGSLKQPRQRLPFLSVTVQDDDYVILAAKITNTEEQEAYEIYEMGIYARLKGTSEEQLYCIITASEPEHILSSNAQQSYEIFYNLLIKVYDSANVYIAFAPDTYVTAERYDAQIRELKEQIKSACQKVRLGAEDTELDTGDILFIVEGIEFYDFVGVAFSNYVISSTDPETEYWGKTDEGDPIKIRSPGDLKILEGNIEVSEEPPEDAEFWGKME